MVRRARGSSTAAYPHKWQKSAKNENKKLVKFTDHTDEINTFDKFGIWSKYNDWKRILVDYSNKSNMVLSTEFT